MTEEQIKAKAKEQFPNDEFDQQIVIDAINWATKELQEENERLKKGGCRLVNCNGRENGIELRKAKIKIEQLEKQIEKMKKCANCDSWIRNDNIKYCRNCPNLEGVKILRK